MSRSIFRLQYTSNLFVDNLEQSFHKVVKPNASSLVLLGNIGRHESPKTYHFLNYCSANWDKVFWVPGPHELSNAKQGRMSLHEKASSLRTVAHSFPNILFMDSKEAVFHKERIVLLGTPLWTKIILPPKGQPEFSTMFTSVDEAGPVPLTNSIRNRLYKDDMMFLKERSLFWSIVHPDINLIYLTHTLPTSLLYHAQTHLSEESWSRMNMDCSSCSMGPPLRAWLSGAGAITNSVKQGDNPEDQVLCAINGLHEYPYRKNKNTNYNPEAVLEVIPKSPSRGSPLYLSNLVLPPLFSSLLQRKVSLQACS